MQTSEPTPTDTPQPSAQRLIAVIQKLAEFDVAQSTEEDQIAVQEAVALTSPEHQQALLIALLLERVRA
ncbi:hypothetical protein GY21_19700 [Cryobacterium roopkundense]|uniref:Uncharacterized protein n=1 Tax=Cryobacterium roopkundense TaxID=1001240 RepID=A0A099J2M6_9MICO|nr:hypothetical protein [Cryobacterium roopkundense]KGJ71807.1 hypothetical protein GY21_19700 [Cryobacterium roopkundense]MBB5639972.1 hypothetical protein [Cryobacterium roopkundense]